MKLRKSHLAAFLIILLIACFAIIYGSTKAHPETIKIGFAGSLSGLNSDLSVSGRNGAMLAVENINNDGGVNGKKLQMVVKDDLNDADQAVRVDKEFDEEGVKLIVGHMTSQMAQKAVSFINEKHLLMISPTIAVDSLSGRDDFFFRVIPSNKTQAEAVCDDMLRNEINRVAIEIDNKNLLFSSTLRDYFIDDFEAKGGEISHTCARDSTKMLCSDCLRDIKANKINGLFVISGSESLALLSQNLYRQGLKTNIYGPAWAMTVDLLEHGGKSVEGAKFVNYYDNTSEKTAYVSFRNLYVNKFGSEPSFSAVLSYEAVWVLAQAMEKSKSADPEILAEFIKTSEEFQGLEGDIRFDQYGDVKRQVYIYQVQDGKFSVIR